MVYVCCDFVVVNRFCFFFLSETRSYVDRRVCREMPCYARSSGRYKAKFVLRACEYEDSKIHEKQQNLLCNMKSEKAGYEE